MTFLEASESGLRFKHKNWCPTCWKETLNKATKKWICDSGVNIEELFSNDWQVESKVKISNMDLLEAFKTARSTEGLSKDDVELYHAVCKKLGLVDER